MKINFQNRNLFHASEPFCWILHKKPLADVLGLLTDGLGVADGVVGDGGEQLLLVLTVKGGLADQHLVQQDTIGPPVHACPIGLVVDDLWCNVVRGPAERLCERPLPDALLAHPEVGDLDVALLVKHDVVQLEVPVDDAVIVKVHDSNQNLCSVENSDRFLELSDLLNLIHEISAIDKLHHKVETIHGLEAGVKLDKEGRLLGQGQDPLLDHGAVDVVVLDDDVLLEDLDRVQLVRALPLGQHHLPK